MEQPKGYLEVCRPQKLQRGMAKLLITVGVTLERPCDLDSDVIGLRFCECRELRAQCGEMQAGNLFVEVLGQEVDIVLVSLLLSLQEVELRQYLVCERARHYEGRVASSASQVE